MAEESSILKRLYPYHLPSDVDPLILQQHLSNKFKI